MSDSPSCLTQDVKQVTDYINTVVTRSPPLISAIQRTLGTLKGYVDNGLQVSGITDSIKAGVYHAMLCIT